MYCPTSHDTAWSRVHPWHGQELSWESNYLPSQMFTAHGQSLLNVVFNNEQEGPKPLLINQQACWPDTETYVWTRQQVCQTTFTKGCLQPWLFQLAPIHLLPVALFYKSYPCMDMQMSFISGVCPSYPKCAKLQTTSGVWYLVSSRAPFYLTLWFQDSRVVEYCGGPCRRSFFGSPAPKKRHGDFLLILKAWPYLRLVPN